MVGNRQRRRDKMIQNAKGSAEQWIFVPKVSRVFGEGGIPRVRARGIIWMENPEDERRVFIQLQLDINTDIKLGFNQPPYWPLPFILADQEIRLDNIKEPEENSVKILTHAAAAFHGMYLIPEDFSSMLNICVNMKVMDYFKENQGIIRADEIIIESSAKVYVRRAEE